MVIFVVLIILDIKIEILFSKVVLYIIFLNKDFMVIIYIV